MGDRYYSEMARATGKVAGMIDGVLVITNVRGKKMAWSDEKKAQAVEMYEKASPTPETSMEVVKEIADELEESPNGVRMILTKAGVYIKKAGGSAPAKAGAAKEGSTKVSKAAAFEGLNAAIKDLGLEPDSEIIEKLTGKAAIYFTEVLAAAAKTE